MSELQLFCTIDKKNESAPRENPVRTFCFLSFSESVVEISALPDPSWPRYSTIYFGILTKSFLTEIAVDMCRKSIDTLLDKSVFSWISSRELRKLRRKTPTLKTSRECLTFFDSVKSMLIKILALKSDDLPDIASKSFKMTLLRLRK
jgi:hypothetical protein